MHESLISNILTQMVHYGMLPQRPATPAELESMQANAAKELGTAAPEEYLALLGRINGLDWNGLVIYGSQRSAVAGRPDVKIEGYVEGNLSLRDFEPFKAYLAFADDGVVLYVRNLATTKYEVVTKVGLSTLVVFDSFCELINDALRAACPNNMPSADSKVPM